MLCGAGINVILAYSKKGFNPGTWVSLNCTARRLEELTDTFSCPPDGTVPLIYCEGTQNTEDEAIARLATNLRVDKLIFITNRDGVFVKDQLVRQMTIDEAQELLATPRTSKGVTKGMRCKVQAAVMACEQGVPRIHIISGERPGALLKETLTCEGLGTMVYARSPYQKIRWAQPKDLPAIVEVLTEYEFDLPLTLAETKTRIENSLVFSVDEEVHGCLLTIEHPDKQALEIAYLIVSKNYQDSDTLHLQGLLEHTIQYAREKGYGKIFLEAQKNQIWLEIYPWFLQLGFKKQVRQEHKDIWVLALDA
ncbi:hypothetical protein HQ544_01025 [Candidatus Falkowbacteria bacterium]|nr:hypothetical protein [Candidatus Falkowbacteria bacterium]